MTAPPTTSLKKQIPSSYSLYMPKETSNKNPIQNSNLKLALILVLLMSSMVLGYFSPSFWGESAKTDSQADPVKLAQDHPQLAPVSTQAKEANQIELVSTQNPAEQVKEHFKMSMKHDDMLSEYCFNCHDDAIQKGNIRLDNLASLALPERLDLFNKMQEQVHLKHMPPKKKSQPTSEERDSLFKWVSTELDKHNASTLAEKLSKPHYANYVDHEKLFSGEIKVEAFSPARLWRRSPYQFDNSIRTVFGVHQNPKATIGELSKINQPFNKGGGEGISDYASLFYADSATFDTLHRNAVFIVDSTLLMAFIEMDYKAQGKTMDDWKADRAKVLGKQKDVLDKMRKKGHSTRYVRGMHQHINQKFNLKTPLVYRDIILADGKPTKEMMEAAIKYHFERTIQQAASQEDLTKYTDFMQDGIKDAGPYFGLRNSLIAILCSPKFIYRSELGLGKPVGDGRTMLSPTELAYAISYALTDKKPDQLLLKSAQNGKLTTREDVKREVTRLLGDSSIDKPRILRFFQEFFGYHHAPHVFKDDKRFTKGYTFFNYAQRYVNDTDVFIQHILNEDKNVFKELLTTEEYFVAHSGDNKAVKIEIEAYQKMHAFFKDKNWKKNAKELIREHKKFVTSLHKKFNHFNGNTLKATMKHMDECEKLGIQSFGDRNKIERSNYLLAYNLPARKWDFPIEQPFVLAAGKRAGILSHPSWLIAHSLNSHTDPVRRGKWVREFLLAGTIPDVPITVDAVVPEGHHSTLRERYSITEAKQCWKCHVKMNPLGFPFEVFDDFGRWRNKENLEALPKIKGIFETKPIDSSGYLDSTGDEKLNGDVKDAYDLVTRLAESRKVQQSIIRHAFRYWMGRNELLSDSKTLIRAEKAYIESDGSFNALIISLLTSDSFIYRKRLDLESN
jgi:hypothetical protein